MWTEGIRHTPMAHGAVRVQERDSLEGPDGFLVIKRVAERQALIEVTLGLSRARGDSVMVVAQTIEQRCRRLLRLAGGPGPDNERDEEARLFHSRIQHG